MRASLFFQLCGGRQRDHPYNHPNNASQSRRCVGARCWWRVPRRCPQGHFIPATFQRPCLSLNKASRADIFADPCTIRMTLTTHKNIAVVGGSLAGLAAANVLSRIPRTTVHVFEKYGRSFETRGSSLGRLDLKLWRRIRGAPMMRLGIEAKRNQGGYYYGDLWKYLFSGLAPGTVRFDHGVKDLGDDIMKPTIDGQVYDAVVIADGGFSSLRHYVNGSEKIPEYSGVVVFRAKLDQREHFPEFTAPDGIYTGGRSFTAMLRVAQDNGILWIMGGVGVGMPENEVVRPSDGANRQELGGSQPVPDWFLPYVRRTYHPYPQLVRWLELANTSRGKISPQPLYEFKADKVTAGRLIMIGDAAHMASPQTTAGAHTGILDAEALLKAFSAHPTRIDDAIAAYAPGGVQRAKDLYERSREASRPFTYQADHDDRWKTS